MIRVFSFSVLLIIVGCNNPESNKKEVSKGWTTNLKIEKSILPSENKNQKDEASKEDSFSITIIESKSVGYGYQILNNGKVYINQNHIPAIQGNKGFKTKEKAKTTASFIIYKLENGLFPPTITPFELDSLGVL